MIGAHERPRWERRRPGGGRAAIEAFEPATSQIVQTTRRPVPGHAHLDQLGGRDRLNNDLGKIIDKQTAP